MSREKIKNYFLNIPREGRMKLNARIYTSDRLKLESSAVDQLKNATMIPSVTHVLATPDIHHGYGVPIGAVVGTSETVVPAAVGYDINCGMRMITTDSTPEELDIPSLAGKLRQRIPLGEGKKNFSFKKDDFVKLAELGINGLKEIDLGKYPLLDLVSEANLKLQAGRMEDGGSLPGDASALSEHAINRGKEQLATLGGGNHFIEIQYVDEIYDIERAEFFGIRENGITIMIHTGSRGFGHQVGGEYMKKANSFTSGVSPYLHKAQLGYLEADSRDGRAFISAMNCAANFAYLNRYLIYLIVMDTVTNYFPSIKPELLYDVPHNILKRETHFGREIFVHRKGATRAFGPERMRGTHFAKSGQPVLIPGSMGTASYVLAGVDGNEETLSSVNHGAGRVMSRTEAKGKYKKGKVVRPAAITDDAFKRSMKGIILHAENMKSIKEEAPQAYKNIDEVIEVVTGAGLAKKVARVKPLAVLKG